MFTGSKNRTVEDPDLWQRPLKEAACTDDDLNYIDNYSIERPKFYSYYQNMYLDIHTKRAALKASRALVSLVSSSDGQEIFQCSGIIVEKDDTGGVILTSTDLIRSPLDGNSVADAVKIVVHLSDDESFDGRILAFDFHYNIVAIQIKSDAPLTIPCLRRLDDSMTIDASHLHQKKSFQLRPHSNSYSLTPGDKVIALGRYFVKPYDLMAAPGKFSVDRGNCECKELFKTYCRITRCGVGGPLVNIYGEVIGICFYDMPYTSFLPINLAFKWWDGIKENGEIHRPWLAMELTNLYASRLDIVESILQKFPNTFNGVVVEEVIPGSSGHAAGILPNDVIVQFGGKAIRSFLELLEMMWNKVGDTVEVIVLRSSDASRLHLNMVVDEATPEKFYSWPPLKYVR